MESQVYTREQSIEGIQCVVTVRLNAKVERRPGGKVEHHIQIAEKEVGQNILLYDKLIELGGRTLMSCLFDAYTDVENFIRLRDNKDPLTSELIENGFIPLDINNPG